MLKAYAAGIFPMAESADDPTLHWVEPRRRGVLPLDALVVSSRLARTIRSGGWHVTVNRCFDTVIEACAAPAEGRENTWINARIRSIYGAMHRIDHAHSVEVWQGNVLAADFTASRLAVPFSARACSIVSRMPRRWRLRISSSRG